MALLFQKTVAILLNSTPSLKEIRLLLRQGTHLIIYLNLLQSFSDELKMHKRMCKPSSGVEDVSEHSSCTSDSPSSINSSFSSTHSDGSMCTGVE